MFGELHLAMLAAAGRDRAALLAAQQRLDKATERGHAGAPVAAQWALALLALVDGDSAGAQAQLTACADNALRLGGSGAQRNVVEVTRRASTLPLL